ncbi:MAG: hypothetical protein HYY48_00175 [Gammaproteobacteria bacterium]|nr:hypothetical protein [Gammaproteobacteria bacterium]
MDGEQDWNRQTLLTRICDVRARQRFAAGSPNETELRGYRDLLLAGTSMRTGRRPRVAVLGMTPELRCTVLEVASALLSIDCSADAIALYRDWVPEEWSRRERIVQAEWSQELRRNRGQLDAILGDGVCGNLATREDHAELLNAAAEALANSGVLILRQALIPDGFDPEACRAEVQIARFRDGGLSEAGFGLGMRLWGFFEQVWDPAARALDNRVVYQRIDALVESGAMTQQERALVRRYYFGGRTMLLTRAEWETLLAEAGFSFKRHAFAGEDWYRYYPLYACRRLRDQPRRTAGRRKKHPVRRRELHICLLEQQDSEPRFGALMARWINERSRRCSASVNRGIETADIVWLFTQDPLGDPRRLQILELLQQMRPGARVMNHPDHYDAYHQPDCFQRLAEAGVSVPRATFADSELGRTQVVYKRMGQQMSEKVLVPFDGPREGFRAFEFVDSRGKHGNHWRYRAFFIAGAVRPSKALACRDWNVCLRNRPKILPTFDMPAAEVEQLRLIARTLRLDFFAVDFLRRRKDGAAVFLDVNIYPRINSVLHKPARRQPHVEFHTFDTRPWLGIPEPGGHSFPEVFDDAIATFASGWPYSVAAGQLNALVEAADPPAAGDVQAGVAVDEIRGAGARRRRAAPTRIRSSAK